MVETGVDLHLGSKPGGKNRHVQVIILNFVICLCTAEVVIICEPKWLKKCVPFLHNIYVVVNFLSQVIFVFLLFWGMAMYTNEVETKDK